MNPEKGIADRISFSSDLYRTFGQVLLQDEYFQTLLSRYDRSTEATRKKLVHLQEIAGEELNTLFMLEQYIKKKINRVN